ncbi:type I-MYXAN CRISPR-associated protein Cas5/Cmx5/DevS [Synechococcus sp. Nb3U1]|uniref:type I-MYXAN CRISPR-associated protein Cas5/Cmx5/DevS n=1 Tax=Synechococcus sp. Nb3U1 TaxID=1914529 RepID=UPI001F166900|nr:type I-MYXAN CRISPR-associated protein Cas5/Cmx5/DevS [Synechococcus sp. Nb3U1]MCF2969657.1 type I-MYXAN CRISPR-associated protein Cas5/Cmx5/DevS [Synechococcus sp. Nb3U1]
MIQLHIEVPIAGFRQSRAQEYAETYTVPPSATVYRMLLSLIGEWDLYRYCGTQLAIALLNQPHLSTVIRTFRRFKSKEIGDPTNARPDYQQLLTNIELEQAFDHPERIERTGGLSLGESRDLVNAVTRITDHQSSGQWLIHDHDGMLTLPYWVDHVGSRGTRWQRYSLSPRDPDYPDPPELAWTEIQFS